jgi:hypothetical protein
LLIGVFALVVCAQAVWGAGRSPSAAHPRACYRSAPARLPANRWPAARQQLAPAGAVAIRLCRYAGMNIRPRLKLLRSSPVTDPRLVAKLVHEFGELPSPSPGAEACPMDDGSQIIALLAYPHAHAARISVGLTGCRTVTNGYVVRTASGFGDPSAFGPRLVCELRRLTRARGVRARPCRG